MDKKGYSFVVQLCLSIGVVRFVHCLQYSQVPYGVLALEEGEARVQVGSYDVAILREHPKETLDKLKPLQHELRQLIEVLKTHDLAQARIFTRRLELLRSSRTGSTKRRRRGLLNVVGELSKTLFGTATEDDVARVRDKLSERTHFEGPGF
jgi:hypothetical protein